MWRKFGWSAAIVVSLAGSVCIVAILGARRAGPLDPRWFDARLSVTREWRPCRVVGTGALAARRCATPPPLTAVELSSRMPTTRSGRGAAPAHLDGLELLVWGGERYADRALRRLSAAAEGGDAAAWNDLGVGYLQRAEWRGAPLDLVRALNAFERAGRLAGDDPTIAFNRAVIRERLFLNGEARRAWKEFLHLDGSSPWADEARERLASLVPLADASAAAAGDAAEDNQGERHRLQEELLPAWAEAALADPFASADLVHDGIIDASALAERSGDDLLVDAFGIIRDAQERGDARTLQLLASGHSTLGMAGAMLESDAKQAARLFTTAKAQLEEARSAFASWAHLGLVRAHYRQMDLPGVEEEVRRLLAALEARPTLAVGGRALWTAGMARLLRGELRAARQAFEQGRAVFAALREEPNEMALLMLLAGVHDQLFEREEAWQLYFEVLARSAAGHDEERRLLALSEAAYSALAVAGPEAALVLQEEVVLIAEALADPTYLVEVLINRATLRTELGGEGGLADLDRAEALAGQLSNADIQALVLARVSAARGRLLVAAGQPAGAVIHLEQGIELLATRQLRVHLPELYLGLSRAHRALGARREAETALNNSLEEIERLRQSVVEDLERIALADRAAEVREELVEIALEEGRADEALTLVETHRSRQLLDRLQPGIATTAVDPSNGAAADATILYEVLAQETVVWVLRNGRRDLVRIGLGREKLAHLASRLHEEATSDEVAAHATLERLHELLVEPLGDAIAGAERLTVVADEQLFQIPFAALRNARRGRFLLDDHEITIVPSLTIAAYLSGVGGMQQAPSSLLAIADPELSMRDHATLPPLPAAREEASAIAARYADARVLVGAEATPEAFLGDLASFEVVHVAAHAVDGGRQPLDSALVLASPADGGGLVTAKRLLAVEPVRTRLVVLAACATSGEVISASEGPLGLAWPLIAQGVPTVVASLWPLEDRSSSDLFARFHALVAEGLPAPAALRRAQIDLRGRGAPLADWAGVVVFGAHRN